MKLKYLLCLLLFPWAAFGVNTNQVDNLWVPVSARFSYGTPAVGKVFTSDAVGSASWQILSSTGGLNDARYVMKAGFSSGPQAVDGLFTITNNTLFTTGLGTQIWTNRFGNSASTNKLFLFSENETVNAALDMLVFIDTSDTREGSIGLRTAGGTVGAGLYLSGGDMSAGSLGVGNGQLQLSGVGAGWSLEQGGGLATTVTTGYGQPVAISGGAVNGTNLTVAKIAVFNGGLISISTNVLNGIRYPLVDGASNTFLSTFGNGTSGFIAAPGSEVHTNGLNLYSQTSTNIFPGFQQNGTNTLYAMSYITNYNVINGPNLSQPIGTLLLWGQNPSSLPMSQLSIGSDPRQGIYTGTSNMTLGTHGLTQTYLSSPINTFSIIGASSNTSLNMGAAGTMTYGAVTHTMNGTTFNINPGTITVTGNSTFRGTVTTTNTTVIGAGGTTITWIRAASGTLGYAGGAAGSTEDKTITLVGVNTNDGVYAGNPIDLPTDSVFQYFVSTTNVITVRRTSTVLSGVYTGVFKMFVTH